MLFSILDLFIGYWQVPLDQDGKKSVSFDVIIQAIEYECTSSLLILSAIELDDLGRQQEAGYQCHQRPSGKLLLNS